MIVNNNGNNICYNIKDRISDNIENVFINLLSQKTKHISVINILFPKAKPVSVGIIQPPS